MFPDKESRVTASCPCIINSYSLEQRGYQGGWAGLGVGDLGSDGVTEGCYQTQDLSLDS